MFNGRRRWTWLGLLAAGNLVLWVGIAYLVGLCASDEVDLGVETLVRHVQATAVSSWAAATGEGQDLPQAAGESPSTLSPRARHQDEESSLAVMLVTAGTSREKEPEATVPTVATERPSDVDIPPDAGAPVSTEEDAGEPASSPATDNPEPVAEYPAPEPAVVASRTEPAVLARATPDIAAAQVVSAPLLLVDPEFHTLDGLNAEMDRSAPGRAVQIRYQEEALNREIATLWLNNPDLPYRDVQVDFQDNGVAISGRVAVLGFEVDAYLQGTVVARDCRPQLEIESVSLAGIMAPRFMRTRVITMVHESMAWYPAGYPLCLEQIVLEETRATFYGHHR